MSCSLKSRLLKNWSKSIPCIFFTYTPKHIYIYSARFHFISISFIHPLKKKKKTDVSRIYRRICWYVYGPILIWHLLIGTTPIELIFPSYFHLLVVLILRYMNIHCASQLMDISLFRLISMNLVKILIWAHNEASPIGKTWFSMKCQPI